MILENLIVAHNQKDQEVLKKLKLMEVLKQ